MMRRIIFCEDDPVIQKLIRTALRNNAYDVVVADNGADGLILIRTKAPVLIFTDISMPVMDGIQLCDILKKDNTLKHIPIILLTAASQREELLEALSHGAVTHLIKPFSTQELRDIINHLLP
ncbi:MAG: response regulator [Roseiflexaceae bacterium]|jgi:CheY-like chemotaxis protein